MVTPSGQVKILDFGLAKLLDDTTKPPTAGIHRTELTEVGVPYGTATYAAPEQARGDRVDERADIFSTGVLLYEMLTGTWPFRGKTTIDVRHAVLHDAPVPVAELRKRTDSGALQQILDRCLAKEPRDRYQKMEELRDDLRERVAGSLNSETPASLTLSVTARTGSRHLAAQILFRARCAGLNDRKVRSPAPAPTLCHSDEADNSRDSVYDDCATRRRRVLRFSVSAI